MTGITFFTKRDGVAERLRTMILSGELAPGEQLRQDEIAERLRVSSTPVREAFGILEAEGFVERRPHRGVLVAERDLDRVGDAYYLRGLLEVEAVKRIVARDGVPTDELERLVQEAASLLENPDVHPFRVLSGDFHRALIQAAGSNILSDLYEVLVNRTLYVSPLELEGLAIAHRAHVQTLHALKRKDITGAEAAIRRHMLWNAARVREVVSKGPRPPQAGG